MTTICLRFPASRYHATPWGRHVNEGVAEWPPSPYRLLRALYDVWKRKCGQLSNEVVESLFGALASSEPRFALPPAAASHTRSYLSSNSLDPTDKNLIFDAFLAFNPGAACYISWPDLDLTDTQCATLSCLLKNLNYLGRSESWVNAALHAGISDGTMPCDPIRLAEYDGEVMSVACVVPPSAYDSKRWLEALTSTTTEMLKGRRSAPPLLRTIRYVRPEGSIETDPLKRAVRRDPTIEAVVLGLDATVLPLTTATIEIAEQIRTRLMGAHRKRMGDDPGKVSPLFSGKDAAGHKRLDHGHLYILPLANHLGRIDRVLLVSKHRPFSRDEIDAIRGVRELYQPDGRPTARCVIIWQGRFDEPGPEFSHARTVQSATPFVTVRHMRRGRDLGHFLEQEVRRECRNQILPEPIAIERLTHVPGLFDAVEYRRNRKDDPVRSGYAFRLRFDAPILAPFTLGYGCHFGLGQFRKG